MHWGWFVTDAELIAAAALVMASCVEAMGENQMRAHRGEAPAYRDQCGAGGRWAAELEIEMERRQKERPHS